VVQSSLVAAVLSTATPVPVRVVSTTKTKTRKKKVKKPTQSGSLDKATGGPRGVEGLAWNPADEDKSSLAAEIAAIPPYSRIKPFSIVPDAMPADMSARRLADLSDMEKYSLWLGHDKQTIQAVVLSSTDMAVTYQSGLVGLLGGKSTLDFYWEDVKAIHCDEVVAGKDPLHSRQFYLFSLILDGKRPFTVQCATTEDMEHLLSAFEFYLKTYRHGNQPPVSIGALPYLYQGLRLSDQGEITLIWADSPAEKAGLKCGDWLWSLEKNVENQQRRADLETGLQSLTPGAHPLYIVTPKNWRKAQDDVDRNHSFNPILTKVMFVSP
jgi:hypothetical protein